MKSLNKIVVPAIITGLLMAGSQTAMAADFSVFPSNSRLSFRGALDADNTNGSSLITIATAVATDEANPVYSTNGQQLKAGDQVYVGEVMYLVTATSANLRENEVALSSTIESTNSAENTSVVHSAMGPIKLVASNHTLGNGEQVVFAFDTDGPVAMFNDGLPDMTGFDFNQGLANITCNDGLTASALPADETSRYHRFICTNNTGADVVLNDSSFYINGLINPVAANLDQDVENEATLINVLSQIQDARGNVIESKLSTVGLINSVTMVVRVAPQLTFSIEGIGQGEDVCGITTDVFTTANDVPFGLIDAVMPTAAAQKMQVSTNAPNGYVVSAIASNQMSLDGLADCAATPNDCIADVAGTPSAPAAWSGSAFGFTTEVVGGDTYLNNGVPNVETTFDYNQGWSAFPNPNNTNGNDQAFQVINDLRSTNGDEVDICYQIQSSADSTPGDYQTSITYTITASF